MSFISASPFSSSTIVRLTLASINVLSLCILRRAIKKQFGFSTAMIFVLLTSTQFHLPFWMGRTLPNMFALPFVNVAYALLISRQHYYYRPKPLNVKAALSLLIFAAIVFRIELALLLAPLMLQVLYNRWLSFGRLVKTCLVSGILSICKFDEFLLWFLILERHLRWLHDIFYPLQGITTLLDTRFWRSPTPLWPELHSLLFNVLGGNASQWGTLPAHTYFTSFLPKLLLTAFPLSILGFFIDSRVRGFLATTFLFISGMSILGHKEWRFIIYCVPIANIAAARGCVWLLVDFFIDLPSENSEEQTSHSLFDYLNYRIHQRAHPLLSKLFFLFVIGCITVNLSLSAVLTQVSMHNYPGGVALSRLNEIYSNKDEGKWRH